ncbi:MAG TPA: hypothetical protein DDZ89_01520 [Clostridiales bacterium]|nr:hypothetical protein [Clostridiales bacterium]
MNKHGFKDLFTATLKTNYHYFGAFFIPILLFGIAYAWFGVYPFGKESVLVLDMYGQYMDYFQNFRSTILGDKSFLYSWGRNLGGEMMGLTAYYVSSPFSLITVLFPAKNILEAVLTMEFLKMGSMGLTMAYYLRKSKNVSQFNSMLFSLLYAMSAYVVVQMMNIMWMDSLIWLPLIALGVERIIREDKYKLFLLCLPVLFVSNFYTAYMTGMFSFFYFFYYYVYVYGFKGFKRFVKKLFLFGICAVVAIGCSLFLILPTYYGMKMGKLEFNSTDIDFKSRFDLFDMFAAMMPGAYDTVRNEGTPFIYGGMILWLLLPAYFLNKDIKTQHKATSGAMLWFLTLSFVINTLDNAWHIFKTPNWLPYRYSYLFTFFVVILCCEAFEHIKGIAKEDLLKFYIGSVIIVFLVQKAGYDFITAEENVWFALICLSVYILLLYLFKTSRQRQAVALSLLLFVSVELTVNACELIYDLDRDVVYSTRASYVDFFEENKPVVDAVQDYDPGFYRLGMTHRRTKNDALSFGFNGLAHSSSTLNLKILDFIEVMGISMRGHWAGYYGTTIVSDSLLGYKYVLSKNYMPFPYYDELDLIDSPVTVYENPYALPIAFGAHERVDKVFLYGDDPVRQQNKLLSAITGEMYAEYFKKIDVVDTVTENLTAETQQSSHVYYQKRDKNKNATVEFLVKGVGGYNLYAFFPTNFERETDLKLNGEEFGQFFGNDTYGVLNLGAFEDGEVVSFEMSLKEDELYYKDALFYYLDMEPFEEAIDKLKDNSLQITDRTETRIKGTVNLNEDQSFLFTTIPYEEGWQVMVDGVEVETVELVDALLGIPITPGEHTVEMKFIPQGFILGSAISIVCFALFILMAAYKPKKRKNPPENVQEEKSVMAEVESTETGSEIEETPVESTSENGELT